MILLPAIALVLSILAFSKPHSEDTANAKGMLTATLGAVTWFIFSAFWAYNFTALPYLFVSYLWFIFGLVFALLAVVYVVQYVSAGFKRQQNQGLRLRQSEDY
jgi:hypothetical protein